MEWSTEKRGEKHAALPPPPHKCCFPLQCVRNMVCVAAIFFFLQKLSATMSFVKPRDVLLSLARWLTVA